MAKPLKEYSAVFTVNFVLSTRASGKREADRKFERVTFGKEVGTHEGYPMVSDGVLRKLPWKFCGVTITDEQSIVHRVEQVSHDQHAEDLRRFGWPDFGGIDERARAAAKRAAKAAKAAPARPPRGRRAGNVLAFPRQIIKVTPRAGEARHERRQ
jgi:hypothetical protein